MPACVSRSVVGVLGSEEIEIPWLPARVAVAVGVCVAVAVGVWVGVVVGVLVAVCVGVVVGVSVGVIVGVCVGVIVGVFVGVRVGVIVGVLVGVAVQVASGVPREDKTSIAPLLVRFHTAKASAPLLAERFDDTFTGAPLELTLTAAPHVE